MHHWPETNESLILRVKDPADAASWSDFLSIYRPVVVRMARGLGLQHAEFGLLDRYLQRRSK